MSGTSEKARLRTKIDEYYLADEQACISAILQSIKIDPMVLQKIEFSARDFVEYARQHKSRRGSVEAFIGEYSLSSTEGIILMCLAEALLRIPDDITADRLIKSKLSLADFETHLGKSHSLFVNASTWGLMLTGKLVADEDRNRLAEHLSILTGRLGDSVIRAILRQAMKLMASQYVMGDEIDSAIKRGKKEMHKNYRFSFDMLGESALCSADAERYFESYKKAIACISKTKKENTLKADLSAISIKLSALHPRYEVSQHRRVINELLPRVLSLVRFACEKDVAVTLDAEESDRLALSLAIFEQIFYDEKLNGWGGFGLAVQAYQKRAMPVLEWLAELAKETGKQIPLRLVKGAYWDTEIKRAQEQGLKAYPVFTRKTSTDVSYIACVDYLLKNTALFYPQFATHNAHTVATVEHLSQEHGVDSHCFEFQRLHGMGESLHDQLIEKYPSRIYSPVGSYQDLLPYLVRRLLENGANASFVNRIENEEVPIDKIIRNPIEVLSEMDSLVNPEIALPSEIYKNRDNSKGTNLSDIGILENLQNKILCYESHCWYEEEKSQNSITIVNPANRHHIIGYVKKQSREDLLSLLGQLSQSQSAWQRSSLEQRLSVVKKFAGLLYENRYELYALCVYEAGKTLRDAVSELREAIDFCEYYFSQAKLLFSQPEKLEGPVGEDNRLFYHGRGLFVCISPWNFPVAIFVGQIVAALISGNVVIAKASSKTAIVSRRLTELFAEAGLAENILAVVNCSGRLISDVLLTDGRVSGVAFTGSFDTALNINLALARRRSPIVPLIAETGGLNAMIVDSSALPEQVVKDVISSAFYSAGQRCSALRVLIVQSEILEKITALLISAMDELLLGDPAKMETDIPPLIDARAQEKLNAYKASFAPENELLHETPMPDGLEDGNYVAPTLVKINALSALRDEMFGPVLHIMSYESDLLDELIDDINSMGFGLTLGVHSRVDEVIERIVNQVNVGNIYVNRNMVGAVVGVQPFGGEGYSGTGPKAGGPNYLQRFCTEKTLTINTAAIGGSADLLAMSES